MNTDNIVSDDNMTVLGRDFPALRELRVESCSIVTRHIASWPELEVRGVEYLSDNVIRKLAAHCPRLRVLIAERCQLVTDAGGSDTGAGLSTAAFSKLQRQHRLDCRSS
jgi:hypothetical protein